MKTAIVKLSGKAIDEFISNDVWIKKITELQSIYDGLVIVHGGGKLISEWSLKFECESRFINGLRVTDDNTMNVVAAVQSGLINSKIISALQTQNIESIGLSGNDRGLFVADYVKKELGFVGVPKASSDSSWLKRLIAKGVVPVFSSICRDSEGSLMNVNADVFTQELAKLISADTVFFVSDVSGVRIGNNYQTVMSEPEIKKGIQDGFITDGMIPKLNSSIELLKHNIKKIWIGNELQSMKLNKKLLTNGGTWIVDTNKSYV